MKKIIIAYVPVLHQGYMDFFQSVKASELWLLGDFLAQDFREIAKDLRRVDADTMAKIITSLNLFSQVGVINKPKLLRAYRSISDIEIIFPDDEISHILVEKYLPKTQVSYDKVFLRWDRKNVEAKNDVKPDSEITQTKFVTKIMNQILTVSSQSLDWWRQVSAGIVQNRQLILATYNQHLPVSYIHYINGDPRALFTTGEKIELTSSIHAEAALIAQAAKIGLKLAEASMFVSTFPCPVCAKQIACCGIKRLYYLGGYSMLDGAEVLHTAGVELIRVKLDQKTTVKILAQKRTKAKKYN